MVADLGDPNNASWISTASSICIAVITPTVSGLTDILGRKYAIITGCLFGIIGSVVAASAHATTTIIAGQVRLPQSNFCPYPTSFTPALG